MDKQQNEFAERLRRIEARKGAAPVMSPAAKTPKARKKQQSEGSGINRIMVFGSLAVFLVGVIAFSALSLMLPEIKAQKRAKANAPKPDLVQAPSSAAATAQAITVWSRLEERRKDMPDHSSGKLGWELWPGQVATADHAPIKLETISTGYLREPNAQPGEITELDPNRRCQLRRPVPGEVVRNVRLTQATGETGLHVHSTTSMAEALTRYIGGRYAQRKKHGFEQAADGRMYQADVFVTDTSAPVYLVLQGLNTNTLWNLHLAPDVTLAHVAMIGDNSALVGLPKGAGVEALRITDFLPDFKDYALEQSQTCMVAPFRQPKDHWDVVRPEKAHLAGYSNTRQAYETGFAAFNAWYSAALGVDADTNLTDANLAAHLLSGPIPAAPIPYQSIEGQPVLVTSNAHILKGDAAVQDAHADLLFEASGGDIALLDPAPVERKAQ